MLDFQHQAAGQTGIFRPAYRHNGQDGAGDTAAQHTGQGNGKSHTGKGDHHVGNAHDDGFPYAADITGHDAQGAAQKQNAEHQHHGG